MLSAVLIVSSTRAHVDAPEILRIQDTVAALLAEGFAVDVLVPRVSSLISAAMPSAARIYTAPRVPFCSNPPKRASLRRFLSVLVMFFRCVSLVSRKDYTVLHGFNDGTLVVRATDRVTVRKYPYVGEIHSPLTKRGFFKGPRAVVARFFECGALKHASAIILPDKFVLNVFGNKIPRARVSLIPDPHVDFAPDGWTYGEFKDSIRRVYDYVLRPGREQ